MAPNGNFATGSVSEGCCGAAPRRALRCPGPSRRRSRPAQLRGRRRRKPIGCAPRLNELVVLLGAGVTCLPALDPVADQPRRRTCHREDDHSDGPQHALRPRELGRFRDSEQSCDERRRPQHQRNNREKFKADRHNRIVHRRSPFKTWSPRQCRVRHSTLPTRSRNLLGPQHPDTDLRGVRANLLACNDADAMRSSPGSQPLWWRSVSRGAC